MDQEKKKEENDEGRRANFKETDCYLKVINFTLHGALVT